MRIVEDWYAHPTVGRMSIFQEIKVVISIYRRKTYGDLPSAGRLCTANYQILDKSDYLLEGSL